MRYIQFCFSFTSKLFQKIPMPCGMFIRRRASKMIDGVLRSNLSFIRESGRVLLQLRQKWNLCPLLIEELLAVPLVGLMWLQLPSNCGVTEDCAALEVGLLIPTTMHLLPPFNNGISLLSCLLRFTDCRH